MQLIALARVKLIALGFRAVQQKVFNWKEFAPIIGEMAGQNDLSCLHIVVVADMIADTSFIEQHSRKMWG